jgi:hypothetical protein
MIMLTHSLDLRICIIANTGAMLLALELQLD